MFYYHVDLRDVITGELPPLFALSLIERLPLGSRYASEVQYGDDWRDALDVDRSYYATANVVDAVNQNTIATGNWKKRPKFDPFPTPQSEYEKKKKKPVTIFDLYRQMGGAGKR